MPKTSKGTDPAEVVDYNKQHYGDVIKEYRTRAGLSQSELARLLGVNKNSITHWESGRVKPDIRYLPQLCQALNITMECFFSLPYDARSMNVREQRLLLTYRKLPPHYRRYADAMIQKTLELAETDELQEIQE